MNTERKVGVVAIAGRPNAGKSTLLNKILGSTLSIVTPKAQTTRERVLGILTEKKGQILFVDTPGIHHAKEGGINEFMMKEVKGALEGVDAVWFLLDPESKIQAEEKVIALLAGLGPNVPVYLVFNKVDLLKRGSDRVKKHALELLELVVKKSKEAGIQLKGPFEISAKTGRGVEDLLNPTWEELKVGPLLYSDEEQLSDRPTKFFVAEMIREQLFHFLGEELPYSCAVEVEKFQEDAKPLRVEAVIHVERDSQKGMVIGAKGAKIKEIGTAARGRIEKFLGTKIFLGLRVDVLKDWSKEAKHLKALGYALGSEVSR
ncbi:MAG: GTPase Era [Bdellovibrionales bacterium]|nr:GTPase Era [Bdellovibrionales bacterium]